MNYGYDTISNGSSIAMPAFIISFGAVDEATGSLYLPSLWTSLWTSMSNLGQAVGAFMAGVPGQTVGRRHTALIFAVMSVVGTFLPFFATRRGMLLVGKTINGAVVGGLMSIGTTYAADIALIKIRGALLQAIVLFAVTIQASWIELFNGSNFKRTFTIAFIMFSTSAIGIPFLTQNIYFLFTVGLAAISVLDIGIGSFFLGAIFVVLGWVSNDKILRRRSWIYSLINNFACMVTVGGLAYSKTQESYWAIGGIMNLLTYSGVYATVGVAWTICPEISSHRLRQYSQSVGFSTGAVGGWLFPL